MSNANAFTCIEMQEILPMGFQRPSPQTNNSPVEKPIVPSPYAKP